MKSQKYPLVFDIARGSFVDGPGIRTVVFLKGCPLRCIWCQNPESHSSEPETFFYPENCSKGCDSMAKRIVGKYYSPQEISEIVLRDKLFYETSEGGVTFSGGEPLLFMDYIKDISEILKKEKVHIAVETCGYFGFQKFEKRHLPLVDLILYDIKMMDPVKHKEYTGKSNDLIIRNFKELLNKDVEILPRIPLVPGYTATKENFSQIARFFNRLNIKEYSFLTYNTSGKEKWERLGKTAPENLSEKPMTLKEEEGWINFFRDKMRSLTH